jgi:periplasmic protein TonB
MTTLTITTAREPREYAFALFAAVLLHGGAATSLLSMFPVKTMSYRFDNDFELVNLPSRPVAVREAVSEPQADSIAPAAPQLPVPVQETSKTVPPVRPKIDRRHEMPMRKAVVKPQAKAVHMEPAMTADAFSETAPPAVRKEQESITAPNANIAYLNNPLPHYPRYARRRHIEGTVVLFVAVSAEGRPASVTIKSSSGSELLDNAAIDAVNNWRFEPARRNGVVTAGEVLVPVTFKLENR